MEDFKYCVWLSPPDGHAWHNFIANIPAHISVAVYFSSQKEARALALALRKQRVVVRRRGALVQTCTRGFYALTQDVELVAPESDVPEWWPQGAHISFAYKYNAPFTDAEIEQVNSKLALRFDEAELSVWRVARATGHYKEWPYAKV